MKWFKSVSAYFFAALTVPLLWSLIGGPFGVWSGFVAGFLVLGPVWYLVHYREWIATRQGGSPIDMGLTIAVAILTKDIVQKGPKDIEWSLLTILIVSVGAVLGGWLAFTLDHKWRKKGWARH
ncbi:Lin0368 family putative glycerol transporter subunit [Streptococcus moroccensis]|uniref:ABC-type sugar transport system permease subunit n=1 Tax=Streptococcus moroccensis TaxID=1451356 RepID=A0ABT9YTG7_9STRE|nr:hypothetical protein [Streptococcus moroccensis]MDQ0223065.1 ABC-type sugar transport system permease subunit [Streptococcus moroccensis]